MTARDWLHIALGAWVGFNAGIVFIMCMLLRDDLRRSARDIARRLRED